MSITVQIPKVRVDHVAAACILLGCAMQAHAQSSVTMYGRIDLSAQGQSRSTIDPDRRYVELHSGGIRPSIWGFKGIEDLGGGLKATFNLEGHIDASTGQEFTQPGRTNQVWRRQSNVGLTSDWGSVQLGRMYSPLILGTIGVEPRAYREQFSQLATVAYNSLASPGNTLGAGSNDSNDIGVFIGNAITYSNNFGPVYLGVGYSLGERPGSNGRQITVGASYTGPVTVGFGYSNVKDSNTGVRVHQLYDLGVAVPLGDFTARLNYIDAENKNPLNDAKVSDLNSIGASGEYKWTERNTVGLAYYNNRYKAGISNAKATTRSVVLSNEYAISKRTTLYAQFAYEDAGAAANPGDALEYLKRTIVIGATAPIGEKTSILSLGISHNF